MQVDEQHCDSPESDDGESEYSESERRYKTPPKKKVRLQAAPRSVSLNFDHAKEFNWARKSIQGVDYAKCSICNNEIKIGSRGKSALADHAKTAKHLSAYEAKKTNKCLSVMYGHRQVERDKVINAELLYTFHIIEHNLPISSSDCAGPLFRKMFPDSKIAMKYGSARTKTSCLINDCLAKTSINDVVQMMKNKPFSLAVDGSSDQDLFKMNPLTVRLYDVNRGNVLVRFLDMCLSESVDAESIFNVIDNTLTTHGISWRNCTSLSVDNAAVNIGNRNSIKTRICAKNSAIYVHGCPCHICNNGAKKGYQAFTKATGFDVEDFAVDLYYWFKCSQNRKVDLKEFCQFCDIEYKRVIKHVSVRWLSLELSITRALTLYDALKSYFLSKDDSSNRFKRLQKLFQNPMTEIYLMFYLATLPLFTKFNLTLQKEDPCIYLLDDVMSDFITKLLGRFMKMDAIRNIKPFECDVNIHKQLSNQNIFVGFTTRNLLRKLTEQGDIGHTDVALFFTGVRDFLVTSVKYLQKNLPFNNDIIRYSSFVNIKNKESDITQIMYFCNRYKDVIGFSDEDFNTLYDQFTDFKCKQDQLCAVEDLNIEKTWCDIFHETNSDGKPKFDKLCKIVELVLTLPHSNASEERVFSIIRKNKTDFRASLQTGRTLSSLVCCKINYFKDIKCHEATFDERCVSAARKVTNEYNQQHAKK